MDRLDLDEPGLLSGLQGGDGAPSMSSPPIYERTSLVVTTNPPFESWTEVLGSERLTHKYPIIEITGAPTPSIGPAGPRS